MGRRIAVMLRRYLKSGRRILPLAITSRRAAWDNAARLGLHAGFGWGKLIGIELATM
jgi:hypothetical protein